MIGIASNTDKKLELYLLEADVSNLPVTDIPIGSKAYVLDTDAEYTFFNGTWYEKNATQDTQQDDNP